MELKHKGKTYELVELKEPITNELFDIIAIFETRKNGDFWELGGFINYFYGASVESKENIKSIALDYIKEYELSKDGQARAQDQNDQPKQPPQQKDCVISYIHYAYMIFAKEWD